MKTKITDEYICQQAAKNIFEAIQEIKYGKPFSAFNYILLHNIYMLASILYYQLNTSPMPDTTFDNLCKYLLYNYEEVKKVVRHADETLSKELLTAGTGFSIKFGPMWWNIALHYERIR